MHVFIVDLPNRPGSLAEVADALGEAGVNITATAGIAAGPVGSLAFTVDDEDAARAALDSREATYREAPMVVASLEHRPGTLADASQRIADAGVNLESMFVIGMDGDRVHIGFGVSDPAAARAALGELAVG
ncbi:MAG: ACT domain-containing protein [Chloroflexota bacterium]|nr:ACT domain-containing protein [Chloroflexota bacterium]